MKKKQIVGLLAAVAVLVTFCGIGYINRGSLHLGNGNQNITSTEKKQTSYNYVAVIHVDGAIQEAEADPIFGTISGYNHQGILEYIDDIMEDGENRGILLNVNSPGGGVYQSDELYLKLEEYKEKTKRPVYSYMKQQAASGAYYISMAADEIGANRNCMTGSIGVIMSTYNLKEFYDKVGIKEVNITSGKNKAMGASGEELTEEQRQIFQSLVDESYEQFVDIVAKGRKLPKETVKTLADGRVYTAKQAKENGLIDNVCTYDDFLNIVKKDLGQGIGFEEPAFSESVPLAKLFSKVKDLVPKSEAEIFLDEMNKKGGLMYYAEY